MQVGASHDDGFTLVETMVSMAIISVVMAALTSFFIGSTVISRQQGDAQAAVQIAIDATERVGAIRGSELLKGRDQASTDRLWAAPAPRGVSPLLTTMTKVADSTAAALDASAVSPAELPTTAEQILRNGVPFERRFYVGACWQPTTAQECNTARLPGYLAFFRVVVAITWSSRGCPASGCAHVTAILVSSSPNDPIINPNTPPPAPSPADPGPQTGQQDVPAELQLTATGGTPALTWISASGLPPGLTMDVSGLITGIPTTVGVFTWTATVRDAAGRTATTAATTWTIRARPQVTGPGDQTTISGTAVSLAATMTGGTAPFVWTASGLPPGLSISAGGVVSGVPDRPQPAVPVTYPVTVTVTDGYQQSASRTFQWTIVPVLQFDVLAPQDTHVGKRESIQVVVTGGVRPYLLWSATGLPRGLSINNFGVISGHVTGGPRTYTVQITVTDSSGTTMTSPPFQWAATT